ncbi:MAG TPA: hypothetical protein VIH57_01435 [Bacteroidales bacterium]
MKPLCHIRVLFVVASISWSYNSLARKFPGLAGRLRFYQKIECPEI